MATLPEKLLKISFFSRLHLAVSLLSSPPKPSNQIVRCGKDRLGGRFPDFACFPGILKCARVSSSLAKVLGDHDQRSVLRLSRNFSSNKSNQF